MNLSQPLWHWEVVSPEGWEVLEAIQSIQFSPQFYLAGGTGLALLLGHRHSYDFDFFSTEEFQEETVLLRLQNLEGCTIEMKERETLHLTVRGVKVSFLGYHYPLLFPTNLLSFASGSSVSVADLRDIACMKISAISSRGTKRDFVDLYTIAQEYNVSELLTLFDKKFSKTSYNRVHLLKSLVYFVDAETEPMPKMLHPLDWEKVKKFFL